MALDIKLDDYVEDRFTRYNGFVTKIILRRGGWNSAYVESPHMTPDGCPIMPRWIDLDRLYKVKERATTDGLDLAP